MRCCSSSLRSQWAIFGGCRGIEMLFLLLLLFSGTSPVSGTQCYQLGETPDFSEMVSCTGTTIILANGAVLDLSNAKDEEVKDIFNPEQPTQPKSLQGSVRVEYSSLTTLPLRMQWSTSGFFITIKNNDMLTKVQPFFGGIITTGTLQVQGNRRLDEGSIDSLKKCLKDGLEVNPPHFTSDSYVQDFGDPLMSFDQLEHCVYIKGNLNIDGNTKTDFKFPKTLKRIKGCLKITNTALPDLDFLSNLSVVGSCSTSHEISSNSICIHPEFEKVLISNFPKISLENPKKCVAECSSAYLLRSKDTKCVVVTDTLTITGMKKSSDTKHLEGIKTILGRLVITNNEVDEVNFFKSLEEVNANKTDGKPAIDIKFNDNLKNFSFPKLKDVVTDEHQKALSVDINGKYNMTDEMRNYFTKKFGKDRVSIYVTEVSRPATNPTGTGGTGTNNLTETKETPIESNTEASGLGGGGIAGIVIGVLAVIAVAAAAGVGGFVYWKISKNRKMKQAAGEKSTIKEKNQKTTEAASAIGSNEPGETAAGVLFKCIGIYGIRHDRKRLRYAIKLPYFEEIDELMKKNREKIKEDAERRKLVAPMKPEDGKRTKGVSQISAVNLVAGQTIDDEPAELEDVQPGMVYMPQRAGPNKEEKPKVERNKKSKTSEKVERNKKSKKSEKSQPNKSNRNAAGHSEKESAQKSQKSEKKSAINSKQQNESKQKPDKKIKVIAHGNLIRSYEEVKEQVEKEKSRDSFPLQPKKRREADAKRMKEIREEYLEKEVKDQLEKNMIHINNNRETALKALSKTDAQKIVEKGKQPLIELDAVAINKDRKRNHKVVLHHPNSLVAGPFLSRAEVAANGLKALENTEKVPNACKIYGFRCEKASKGNGNDEENKKSSVLVKTRGLMDKRNFQKSSPVVYEQSFEVTAKRMMDHPQEIIDEAIAYDKQFGLTKQFDLLSGDSKKEYDMDVMMRHWKYEEKDLTETIPSLAYHVTVHEFKHISNDKSNPAEETGIFAKPPADCSDRVFAGHIIGTSFHCELYRWILLEPSEIKRLCSSAIKALSAQALVRIGRNVRIVGEVRGKFDDLRKALSIQGKEDSTSPRLLSFVFLGNYLGFDVANVDTICLLFALKVYYGDNVVLLRGMTEWREMNKDLKFYEELKVRYEEDYEELYQAINEVFDRLPLACRIGKNILCVHGGIVPEIEELEKVKLPIKELVPDTLPFNLMFGHPNYTVKRYFDNADLGAGYYFGEEALYDLMQTMKVDTVFISKALSTGFGTFGNRQEKLISLCSASNLERSAARRQIAVADCLEKQLFIRVAYEEGPEEFHYIAKMAKDPKDQETAVQQKSGLQNISEANQTKPNEAGKEKPDKSGPNEKSAQQQPKSAPKTGNDKQDKSGPNQKSAPQQPKSGKQDKSGTNQSAVQPSGAKSAAASGAGGASKAQEPPRKLPSKPGSTSTNTGAKDAASKM